MKLVMIVLLCFWLTTSDEFIPKSRIAVNPSQVKRRMYEGNYTEYSCEYDNRYNYDFLNDMTTLSAWNAMREIPLTYWDCEYYKMINNMGVPDFQVEMAEPFTDIFTWMDAYNGESNSDRNDISVNSIIAAAFWPATGGPTFIALILLCLGRDVDYSSRQKKKEEKNQNEEEKKPEGVNQ